MRVGQSPFSAHQAGMSALWHDADYVPEQRFETPVVQKHGVEDFALPSEQHQLPDGVDDPFKKLDAVFEVAAEQMERGLKGTAFLHGKPPVSGVAEPLDARDAEDVMRMQQGIGGAKKGTAADHKIVESVRADLEQVRLTNQAAATPIPKARGSTTTAAEKEAMNAAPQASSVGDVLGTAATFVPMAVGSGVQSAVQGPLPALASQAVTLTGAAASAAQVSMVGVAEATKDEEPVVVRRGLASSKKSDR